MIKAVLLDLDNTLLLNPDREFAQAFMAIFERHFQSAGFVDSSQKLRKAIQKMSDYQAGNRSNYQTLVDTLSDGVRSDTEAILERFYDEVFPQLKPCITPVAGAAKLIYRLREMGVAIVIATNPIYPERAIRQRMEWAQLPNDDDFYSLITSADNMHFAKPDPAYYAEILGRVGIEPDEAIMVGDSMRNDILPAQQVGLQTCYIGENGLGHFSDEMNRYFGQSLALDLRPEMIEPQLRGNIGAVYGFVDTVQDHYWHQRPDPKEWSIIQILCHLVTNEEDHQRRRLLTILQNDNPFITQPQAPGPDIVDCADTGLEIAEAFMRTRQETIALVRNLSSDDWQRPARHSIFGLTTLLEMAYFTAQHDRLHLNQLCQTIGRCD
ncbi:MAG: HAD-IA family hydrolase [Phototrophicaceae bacterium]